MLCFTAPYPFLGRDRVRRAEDSKAKFELR